MVKTGYIGVPVVHESMDNGFRNHVVTFRPLDMRSKTVSSPLSLFLSYSIFERMIERMIA